MSHVAGEVITLCTCWTVSLLNGQVFRFTDHDQDVSVLGQRFVARVGYDASDTESASGFSVSNLDVRAIMSDESISESDLRSGLWDFARIQIEIVNYASPNDGTLIWRYGTIGQVSVGRDTFQAELRGIAQSYEQGLVQVYSEICRARFGDSRCKFPVNYYVFDANVIQVISRREFRVFCPSGAVPSLLASNDRLLRYGRAVCLTGSNTGFSMEIKDDRDESGGERHITLQLPLTYNISVGDTFTLSIGCDKTIQTCNGKFDNVINFRGEPYVPLADSVVSGSKSNTIAPNLVSSNLDGGGATTSGGSETGAGGGGSAGGGVIVNGVDSGLAGTATGGGLGTGVTSEGGGTAPTGTTGGGAVAPVGSNFIPTVLWGNPSPGGPYTVNGVDYVATSTCVAYVGTTLLIIGGRPHSSWTATGWISTISQWQNMSGTLDSEGNCATFFSASPQLGDELYYVLEAGGAGGGVGWDVTVGGDWTQILGLTITSV